MNLLPVVEGYGDAQAVPALMRNTLYANEIFDVHVLKPYRLGELTAIKRDFPRHYQLISGEGEPVFWVLDCDDGCAKDEVAALRTMAGNLGHLAPIEFSFVVKEYESLFLAERHALVAEFPALANVPFPNDPEAIRGAKEWISRQLPIGIAYKPTIHQRDITVRMELGSLRASSASFRHFEKALLRLVSSNRN